MPNKQPQSTGYVALEPLQAPQAIFFKANYAAYLLAYDEYLNKRQALRTSLTAAKEAKEAARPKKQAKKPLWQTIMETTEAAITQVPGSPVVFTVEEESVEVVPAQQSRAVYGVRDAGVTRHDCEKRQFTLNMFPGSFSVSPSPMTTSCPNQEAARPQGRTRRQCQGKVTVYVITPEVNIPESTKTVLKTVEKTRPGPMKEIRTPGLSEEQAKALAKERKTLNRKRRKAAAKAAAKIIPKTIPKVVPVVEEKGWTRVEKRRAVHKKKVLADAARKQERLERQKAERLGLAEAAKVRMETKSSLETSLRIQYAQATKNLHRLAGGPPKNDTTSGQELPYPHPNAERARGQLYSWLMASTERIAKLIGGDVKYPSDTFSPFRLPRSVQSEIRKERGDASSLIPT